jgi:anti-sigma B factor antagonist
MAEKQLIKSEEPMKQSRPVIVLQLPERLNLQQARIFYQDLSPILEADRPLLVFDFSEVRQLDSAGVDMLLRCMEEAMKRDGDLKLACVPPRVAVVLELTRVDRLFEVYETATEAAESFSAFPVAPASYAPYGTKKPIADTIGLAS